MANASVQTAGGTWTAQVYEATIGRPGRAAYGTPPGYLSDKGYGCRILLCFEPNSIVHASKIGLLQRCEKQEKGKNYDDNNREGALAGITRGQQRKAGRCNRAFTSHIDRTVQANHPIYGAPNGDASDPNALADTPTADIRQALAAVQAGAETPSPKALGPTYQLGYRKRSVSSLMVGHRTRDACLFDEPLSTVWADASGGGKEPAPDTYFRFETAAVEVQRAMSMHTRAYYYGSVSWGFEVRNKQVHLLPLEVCSQSGASRDMRECVESCNAYMEVPDDGDEPLLYHVQLPPVP